jgi:hypothetical protein
VQSLFSLFKEDGRVRRRRRSEGKGRSRSLRCVFLLLLLVLLSKGDVLKFECNEVHEAPFVVAATARAALRGPRLCRKVGKRRHAQCRRSGVGRGGVGRPVGARASTTPGCRPHACNGHTMEVPSDIFSWSSYFGRSTRIGEADGAKECKNNSIKALWPASTASRSGGGAGKAKAIYSYQNGPGFDTNNLPIRTGRPASTASGPGAGAGKAEASSWLSGPTSRSPTGDGLATETWRARIGGPASTASKPGDGAGKAEASSWLSRPTFRSPKSRGWATETWSARVGGPASTASTPGGGAGKAQACSCCLAAVG